MAEIKGQAPKAQAPARPGAPGVQKSGNKNKKKKSISAGMVMFLLLFVMVAAAVCFVYFDLFGFKYLAADALGLFEPTQQQLDAEAELAEEQKKAQDDLAQEELSLKNKESALQKRESDVKKAEKELDERRAELDEIQTQLEAERAVLQAEASDITALTATLENMDAERAAQAISGLGAEAQMAMLLLNMDNAKAAAIMDLMEPALATRILAQMIDQTG